MEESTLMITATPREPLVVLDEFGYYFGGLDEGVKEELRVIDGVPNASYLVKDGRVFVFDKLVQLVKENRMRQPELPLADLARSLIADATVTAKEAVEAWGVVPEPYEMVEHPANGLMIRHRPFNARLPGVFESKADVQEAFARLLVGGVHPGSGDFVYKGQRMTLCDPIDMSLLPPRPAFHHLEGPDCSGYAALGNVAYESGFEPVSEALFDDAKAREAAWKCDAAQAARYANAHVADLWSRTATLQLAVLNDSNYEVPEYGQDDMAKLRLLYPELSMLSDGALYAWFDEYQTEVFFINGWTACREEAFLFYLLGKLAGHQHEQDAAIEAGKWAGYAVLRGDAPSEAFAFGRAAVLYSSAISRMARWIADAMQFVAEDRKATALQGAAITTMTDFFRLGRKYAVKPVLFEQEAADFR